MIPPSYIYPWLDKSPAKARPRRFRAAPCFVASLVAGGVSGIAGAVTIVMAGLV